MSGVKSLHISELYTLLQFVLFRRLRTFSIYFQSFIYLQNFSSPLQICFFHSFFIIVLYVTCNDAVSMDVCIIVKYLK